MRSQRECNFCQHFILLVCFKNVDQNCFERAGDLIFSSSNRSEIRSTNENVKNIENRPRNMAERVKEQTKIFAFF